jgi:hypothetical protein
VGGKAALGGENPGGYLYGFYIIRKGERQDQYAVSIFAAPQGELPRFQESAGAEIYPAHSRSWGAANSPGPLRKPLHTAGIDYWMENFVEPRNFQGFNRVGPVNKPLFNLIQQKPDFLFRGFSIIHLQKSLVSK